MKRIILAVILGLCFSAAQATDVVGQRYIDKLTRGGMVSIKQAAQSIYNTAERDTEVLDVAAEVLLHRYSNAGNGDIDSLAWLCRAIGSSRNGRYHNVLQEVVDGDTHRKLRKYAKKALKEVGKAEGAQYVKGTVDLAALRNSEKNPSAKKKKAAPKSSPTGEESIDVVREGMSVEEVYELIGHPTATTTHQTGKAWVPFNFGAKDLARTILLYKGQGRIICSHDGYSSTSRVIEVIVDSEETGYP